MILCLVGAMAASPLNEPSNEEVEKEVQDFVNLLPLDQITALPLAYAHDAKFQETINFLTTDQYQEVVSKIVNTREVRKIKKYFDDHLQWYEMAIEELRRFIVENGGVSRKLAGKLL